MMNKEYKHGWHIAMEYDEFPLGLNEDIVRALSAVKDEPEWLLDLRLRAYRRWLTMEEPDWSDNRCPALTLPYHLPSVDQRSVESALLDFWLRAYRRRLTMEEPNWSDSS